MNRRRRRRHHHHQQQQQQQQLLLQQLNNVSYCKVHRKCQKVRSGKHIYLSNMTGYQKSHWLNNAGSP